LKPVGSPSTLGSQAGVSREQFSTQKRKCDTLIAIKGGAPTDNDMLASVAGIGGTPAPHFFRG
jgi:hypothetical protein